MHLWPQHRGRQKETDRSQGLTGQKTWPYLPVPSPNERPCLWKPRWIPPGEWHQRVTSGLHTYAHIHTCTHMNKYTPAHTHKNKFLLFKLVRIKRKDFFLLLGIRDKLTGSLNCGHSHCNLLMVFCVEHIVFRESWFWFFPNLQAYTVMLAQCPLSGE